MRLSRPRRGGIGKPPARNLRLMVDSEHRNTRASSLIVSTSGSASRPSRSSFAMDKGYRLHATRPSGYDFEIQTESGRASPRSPRRSTGGSPRATPRDITDASREILPHHYPGLRRRIVAGLTRPPGDGDVPGLTRRRRPRSTCAVPRSCRRYPSPRRTPETWQAPTKRDSCASRPTALALSTSRIATNAARVRASRCTRRSR